LVVFFFVQENVDSKNFRLARPFFRWPFQFGKFELGALPLGKKKEYGAKPKRWPPIV